MSNKNKPTANECPRIYNTGICSREDCEKCWKEAREKEGEEDGSN